MKTINELFSETRKQGKSIFEVFFELSIRRFNEAPIYGNNTMFPFGWGDPHRPQYIAINEDFVALWEHFGATMEPNLKDLCEDMSTRFLDNEIEVRFVSANGTCVGTAIGSVRELGRRNNGMPWIDVNNLELAD